MIEYYADLARKYNNKRIGRYRNAICFIADDSTISRSMDRTLNSTNSRIYMINSPSWLLLNNRTVSYDVIMVMLNSYAMI